MYHSFLSLRQSFAIVFMVVNCIIDSREGQNLKQVLRMCKHIHEALILYIVTKEVTVLSVYCKLSCIFICN